MDAPNPPFECVVSADLFSRALAAISKEDTRYHLNGVNVEPCDQGGVLLVSTDGRRMLVLRDPDGYAPNGAGTVSLNKDMVRALIAKSWNLPNWLGPLTGKGPKRRLVVVRGQKAAVTEVAIEKSAALDYESLLALADAPSAAVGGYQWIGAVIGGAFPDWRKVIGTPAAHGVFIGAFDASLLAPLAKALSGSDPARPSRSESPGVRLVPTDGDTEGKLPLFIFPTTNSAGFAVLMPMRDQLKSTALPAWMEPAVAMAAA